MCLTCGSLLISKLFLVVRIRALLHLQQSLGKGGCHFIQIATYLFGQVTEQIICYLLRLLIGSQQHCSLFATW